MAQRQYWWSKLIAYTVTVIALTVAATIQFRLL